MTHVYFVESKELGLTRIGVAQDANKRLEELDTASPVPLTLAGFISRPTWNEARTLARRLYKQFAPSRIRGEWFKLDAILAKAVSETLLEKKTVPPRAQAIAAKQAKRTEQEAAWFEDGKSAYHMGAKFNDFPNFAFALKILWFACLLHSKRIL